MRRLRAGWPPRLHAASHAARAARAFAARVRRTVREGGWRRSAHLVSRSSPPPALPTGGPPCLPQELTLVGRSTVLIKGIASRLGVSWSLANEWEPIARGVLERQANGERTPLGAPPRLASILRLLRQWAAAKCSALVLALPPPLRSMVASVALRLVRLRAGRESTLPASGGAGEAPSAPA